MQKSSREYIVRGTHLLHQSKLFSLLLVQAHGHGVLLLQPLQGQDEQLGVVLVGQRRERDGARTCATPASARWLCKWPQPPQESHMAHPAVQRVI